MELPSGEYETKPRPMGAVRLFIGVPVRDQITFYSLILEHLP